MSDQRIYDQLDKIEEKVDKLLDNRVNVASVLATLSAKVKQHGAFHYGTWVILVLFIGAFIRKYVMG
jgi:hypothetical protein